MNNIIKYENIKFEKYIDNIQIVERSKEIAANISSDYIDEEILFIGVLNGCIPFMNVLLSNISNIYNYNFIKISSYSRTTSGVIRLELGLSKKDIFNKHIVIVEDIIDSGKSIKYINDYISQYKPKSIKIVTLLVKKKSVGLCDCYGFKISDKFVVGFGMDINGSFRDLKDIYIKI